MDNPPLQQQHTVSSSSSPAFSPRRPLETPTVSPRLAAAAAAEDQDTPCYETRGADSSPKSQQPRHAAVATPKSRSSGLLSPFRLFGASGCSEDISGFSLFVASNSQDTLDGRGTGGGQSSSQSGDSPQSPIIKAASLMYGSLQRGAAKIGQKVLKPYAGNKLNDDEDDFDEEEKEEEFSLLYNASSPRQEPRRIFGVDDEFHRNKANFETKRVRRL